MKLFISWSGERSEALARGLREWLPLVLHFIEPWLSQSDIQPGERWSAEVAKELEGSNFGIICVSRDNLSSPWLLFEAGALAKSMQDGRVIPLLLDLDFKEVTGPLAQFQAKKSEASGIKELVSSLNKAATAPVPELQLDRLFSALWPDLEKSISTIPKGATPAKHNRPQGEILEDLVSGVRAMEMRIRDVMEDDPATRRSKRSYFRPGMLHDLMYRVAEGPGDPIVLLVFGGLLRDEAPWLYELALEAYRSMRFGARAESTISVRRFFSALDSLQKTPFLENIGIDRGMLKAMRHDFLDRFQSAAEEDAPYLRVAGIDKFPTSKKSNNTE
jgi:hypothetical protein